MTMSLHNSGPVATSQEHTCQLIGGLFQSELKGLLSENPANAKQWIDTFRMDPYLAACLDKDAGVGEGYTVGEHTLMVLETALRYRSTFEEQVVDAMLWQNFMLFLALHDIGKGIALEKEGDRHVTAIARKDNELAETRPIMESVMSAADVSPVSIRVALALLKNDTQGLYLKGEIHENEAFDHVIENAMDCDIEPLQFYRLLTAFHAYDAASYPFLMHRIFTVRGGKLHSNEANEEKIESLTQRLQHITYGRKVFTQVLSDVAQRKTSEKVQNLFLSNLKPLIAFLTATHKKLLKCPEGRRDQHKDEFLQVKKGMRDIFVFAGKKYISQSADRLETYKKETNELLANHKSIYMWAHGVNAFFKDAVAKLDANASEVSHDLACLIDEYIQYRKNYLCRYSFHKVQQKLSEPTVYLGIPDSAVGLLGYTFFHGTNSAIWAGLRKTNMTMVPTGRLIRQGISPLSGELREGCKSDGINIYKLSGCPLDFIETPLKYASERFFISLKEETKRVDEVLRRYSNLDSSPFKTMYDTFIADLLTRASFALRRLKGLDPKGFKERQEGLQRAIMNLRKYFRAFKEMDEYKMYMPKELDPDKTLGYEWRDRYYYNRSICTQHAIEEFAKAFVQPIATHKDVDIEVKPYPMVLASKSLHTSPNNVRLPQERCSVKQARLVEDIQVIFIKPKHHDRLQQDLAAHGLQGRLKVMDIAILRKVYPLAKLMSPYFADSASSKKLSQ